MNDCLNCGKELNHVPGRREKKFCNANCRVAFFYKKNPKKKTAAKTVVKDYTKPTNEVKPPEQPKTNHTIDTTQNQLPEKPDWMKQLELRRQQNKK